MPRKAPKKPIQSNRGHSGATIPETPEKTPQRTPESVVSDDFRKFLYLFWKHLNLPDPTPVQYDIAEYLQNGPKRSCVQGCRQIVDHVSVCPLATLQRPRHQNTGGLSIQGAGRCLLHVYTQADL